MGPKSYKKLAADFIAAHSFNTLVLFNAMEIQSNLDIAVDEALVGYIQDIFDL